MASDVQVVSGPALAIEGPQTIADVERELSEVQARRPARLVVPVRPKKWWFGGEASLIQLLVTWGRSRTDATLVTHVGEGEDPAAQLTSLVSRPFGLVAVWMARDVTDRKGTRDMKVAANKASESELDLMWFGRRGRQEVRQPLLWGGDEAEAPEVTSVGDRVFLASIDHHPRWRIPPCYFPTGEVRYREDFVALADAMAKKAMSGRGGSPVTADLRAPLGAILHELFKNTHEWARTDETGVPLLRSVRGILAQGHTWAEQEAMEVAQGSQALHDYLAAPASARRKGAGGFWNFPCSTADPAWRSVARRVPEGGGCPRNPYARGGIRGLHGVLRAVELFHSGRAQGARPARGHADPVAHGRFFPCEDRSPLPFS